MGETLMQTEKKTEEICCPKFDSGPWDEKILDWKNKRFVKAKVTTICYMPLNFGGVMKKMDKKIREAGATIPENMGLSDHTSKWNMDVYLAVDKEIPGLENTVINGKFLSKVFEGAYSDTGKWCKEFAEYAKKQGIKTGKMYMWYTTCPKCVKTHGKNYVAIISEII